MSTTFRLMHLSGGLRCCLKPEIPRLDVWPFASNAGVQVILDDGVKSFLNILQDQGLVLIGVEERIITPRRPLTALWQVYPHIVVDIDPDEMPAQFWSGIATAARPHRHPTLREISLSIAFSLIAMERHLLALSNEYHRELEAALERGGKTSNRFASLETYDLWLATHGFLLAAGSARDYLAQALAGFVFYEEIGPHKIKKIDSMQSLVEHGRRKGYLRRHAVGDIIVSITDRQNDSAWLADLSEYRNVITHRAPITGLSESDRLELRHTGAFGDHNVLQVMFGLPDKPRSLEASTMVDAMNLMRYYNQKMAELAFEVGKLMPYQPDTINLNENNVLQIEKL